MSRTRLPFFPRICRSEAIRNDLNAKSAVVAFSEDFPARRVAQRPECQERDCRSFRGFAEAIRNDPNAKSAVVFFSEDLPKQSDLQTTDGNNAVVTFFENLPDMQSALNFV